MTGILVLVGAIAVALVLGLVWQRRNGRFRARSSDNEEPLDNVLSQLGLEPQAEVTLLQFSSAFCQPCVATRRILADVASMVDGVEHVEIDAESHLEAVRALGIMRTPTVIVLDSAGSEVKRASGLPRKADVIAAIGAVASFR